MPRPSIVFFNRVYPPVRGATGRVLRDLARAFAQEGWRVTIVTTSIDAKQQLDGQIHVIRVKSPRNAKTAWGYFLVWLRMLHMGFKLPPHDIVVSMTDPPLFVVAARFLAKFKKSRHIHWCQDLFPDILPSLGYEIGDGWMRFLKGHAHRALKSADKIVAIGRCMAFRMTQNGIEARRIAVIPNWPDAELFDPERKGRRAKGTRNAGADFNARPFGDILKDGAPKFRVLYSGNLGRAHPFDTIVDTAALLAARAPDVEFVFVGDGPNFDRLAQERAARGLENIRFLPYQPASRLRALMESGDLHLITMHRQTAGLLVPSKLYSALAVGRPCILVGPEDSEAAQVIRDFQAGSVIDPGDVDGLCRAILQYRQDSDVWFAAHEGAKRAGQTFTPEEAINAWIERACAVAGIPRTGSKVGGGRAAAAVRSRGKAKTTGRKKNAPPPPPRAKAAAPPHKSRQAGKKAPQQGRPAVPDAARKLSRRNEAPDKAGKHDPRIKEPRHADRP